MRYLTGLAVGLVALVGFVSPAQAYVFGFSNFVGNVELALDGSVVRPLEGGWYGADGFHDPGNPNYIVTRTGEFTGCLGPCNNFLVFDISNLTSPVISAALRINSFTVTTTDTYTLFDYTGSIASLVAGTGGLAAHLDLASGISFGSRLYGPGDSGLFRSINLNSNFLTAINTAIRNEQTQFAFGGTLEPAVPEPATLTLTGLGLLGLLIARRRKRGTTD